MAEQPLYKRPYFDSGVFIGWIKKERIPQKDEDGNIMIGEDGKEVIEERGMIAEHLLTLAEQRVFPVVISGLTIAEVHKRRGKEKLINDENQNVLDYFEHEFVNVVPIDRKIGEEANKLCRKHEDKKLSPSDAIHLACAKKGGCDVLLSWDGPLNSIDEPGIRIEKPVMWNPPERIKPMEQMPLLKEIPVEKKSEGQEKEESNQ